MTLHLYDTSTRSVRPFVPLVPGKVSMYVCGATVQGIPHIGHTRSSLVFDVLNRWLVYSGYEVSYVRNVTDIDDKILTKAADAHRPWWEWATTHERAFIEAYRVLGCLPPSIEPRATGHIPQMISMIEQLIETGHAYAAGGDAYFAVRSLPDYGKLSGQQIDEMTQGESLGAGKRDSADFTLWKAAKPGEPAWESPWGPGRPGWHIECSAMARAYLGAEFDIHGGGLDLVFPHHENERAQSNAAGDSFARFWLHNHWVTLAGEKMSKSLGNTATIDSITSHTRPIALRYYLIGAHYRSPIEYSQHALADAVTAFERVQAFLFRAADRLGAVEIGLLPSDFVQAMDDDLALPRALAVLHDYVRAGNSAVAAVDDAGTRTAATAVRSMLAVLGIDPFDPQWSQASSDSDSLRRATDALVVAMLAQRAEARAAKDFATSDQIRDQLAHAGIVVEDGRDGATWSLAH
ncbi:cysteine--tRNA ligase [Nakamurella antarctica]|uniref:Cysteine--tRNA ligase n=1 Tax=Nakamurella antarctica TaxID=1902245 RepID=A0A3G8ZQA8_9ACTN|nr:cysteine--tRNA ligase [Nakamurella antarctica]AZI58985.1 cysteine--tRNA ligase [Nakamurella antarctica]